MLVETDIINLSDLDYYISIIPKSKLSNNYREIINILYDMFNITVTLEQLEEYFSPSANEIEDDLKLQYKHLGLV